MSLVLIMLNLGVGIRVLPLFVEFLKTKVFSFLLPTSFAILPLLLRRRALWLIFACTLPSKTLISPVCTQPQGQKSCPVWQNLVEVTQPFAKTIWTEDGINTRKCWTCIKNCAIRVGFFLFFSSKLSIERIQVLFPTHLILEAVWLYRFLWELRL